MPLSSALFLPLVLFVSVVTFEFSLADPEVSSAQPDNNVRGNSGYITSRNYPENYPNDEDYEVTVTLDQAGPQTVELTLDDFDVERCTLCDCDNVLINGDGSNRLCGVKNGQKISVDVAGDTFTVTLHTDDDVEKRGFNISYNVEQEPSATPTPQTTTTPPPPTTLTTAEDEKACSIRRHGTLTMFNGETTDVELPCKYRLADFTCGDYRVKVTPGSAVDEEDSHRFSPDTVWVKVVNANTNEFVKIRTSVRRLDKFSENRTTNPWQVKEGSKSVVDFADYDQSRAAAVLRKDGVFSVEFSSAERSVVVTCSDREFVSEGLPESLCGDETTTDAMNNAMTTLFPGQGNMTDDALVSYIVLNHDNVVQSPTCKDLASKFTSCQDKEQAAMECVAIFGDQAECLAGSDTSLRDYYADCLTSVCDDVISALEPMDKYIREHCGPWVERLCSSDADCPDGINVGCLKGKCRCTPGYFYSFGQDVCMDGPCQEDKRLYCPDGTCMYEDSLCNTIGYGCKDHSDELNCPMGCSGDNQFQCDNGYCLATKRVCDQYDDCNDGSDERNCEQVKCSNSRAKCADNTTCVSKSDICDGRSDCPDGSDEDSDFCKDYTCLPGMAKCVDNITCKSICDGRNECPDNEDEGPQFCKEYTCLPGEVKCADNATCVKGYDLCDGHANCPDELDEDPQFCKDHTCVPGRVKCADNLVCILKRYLCDGIDYCFDNSDEDQQMCEEHTCVSDRAKCADNVTCVHVKRFCDSFNNCPDKSDEDPEMCKDHTCVPGWAKKCADGVTCVRINYFCDGYNHCPDNSDEDPTLCGQGPE